MTFHQGLPGEKKIKKRKVYVVFVKWNTPQITALVWKGPWRPLLHQENPWFPIGVMIIFSIATISWVFTMDQATVLNSL